MYQSMVKGLSVLLGVLALCVSFWFDGLPFFSSPSQNPVERSLMEFSKEAYLEGDSSDEIHQLLARMDETIAETDLSTEELQERNRRAKEALRELKVDVRAFISASKSSVLDAQLREQQLQKLIETEEAEVAELEGKLSKAEADAAATQTALSQAENSLIALHAAMDGLKAKQDDLRTKISQLTPILTTWQTSVSEKRQAIADVKKLISDAEANVASLRRSEQELQTEINELRAEEARRNKPKKKKKAWYDPAGW